VPVNDPPGAPVETEDRWAYIKVKSVTLSSSAPYTKLSTSWVNSPTFFRVRVSMVGNGPGTTVSAWVDDLSVTCA
jgi:hypothetical protein